MTWIIKEHATNRFLIGVKDDRVSWTSNRNQATTFGHKMLAEPFIEELRSLGLAVDAEKQKKKHKHNWQEVSGPFGARHITCIKCGARKEK